MKKTLLTAFIFVCASNISFAQPFAPLQIIDPNTGQEPYEIASGDLDGDGDMDIVMATYFFNGGVSTQDYIKWYQNDGMGNFTIMPTVSSTIRWVDGLTVADIDGQFGLDIIATSVNQDKLVYFLSDGAGGFGSEIAVDSALSGPGEVVAGDINNDGNIDLITMSYNDNKTVWYAGDGAGNFNTAQIIESGTTNGPYYVDVADFDGDTDLDVVVGFFNSQSVEIFYNQFIESGTSSVSWIKDAVTVNSGNIYLFGVGFADVNNDGIMDVYKTDLNSGDVAWYNKTKNGASIQTIISNETIIDRPAKAYVVDIDNDTFNDVIVTDGGSKDDAIIYFKGAFNASPSTNPTFIADNNHQLLDITVEDFDADGDMDIAAIGKFSDTVEWFENQLIVLGITSNTFDKVLIYPNPTKNQLYFKGLNNMNSVVTVFDVLGNRVISASLNFEKSLDVSQLKSGSYFLKFDNNNSIFKFIKQ